MRLILYLTLAALPALSQGPASWELLIEVDKTALYLNDNPDYMRLASNQNATVRAVSRNFAHGVFLGDIVSVNGKPARGTYVARIANINLSTNPPGGQAIADATRGAFIETLVLEVAEGEAVQAGMLVGSGFLGGTPPPGDTGTNATGNVAIQGGNGAFTGAKGWLVFESARPARGASATEDPSLRRTFDGGFVRLRIGLIRALR